MSGKHADITCRPDGTAALVDVGSTNGTFFGGQRIAPQTPLALTEGTAFTLGKTPVTFRGALASAAPAADAESPMMGETPVLPEEGAELTAAPGIEGDRPEAGNDRRLLI
jgi:pSer/pThr/pTyr-binding forkhead associated (FHA) protein